MIGSKARAKYQHLSPSNAAEYSKEILFLLHGRIACLLTLKLMSVRQQACFFSSDVTFQFLVTLLLVENKFMLCVTCFRRHEEYQYLDAIQTIMDRGVEKSDRAGTGIKSIFGMQFRYYLRVGENLPCCMIVLIHH